MDVLSDERLVAAAVGLFRCFVDISMGCVVSAPLSLPNFTLNFATNFQQQNVGM
jgi:hypothetical protein